MRKGFAEYKWPETTTIQEELSRLMLEATDNRRPNDALDSYLERHGCVERGRDFLFVKVFYVVHPHGRDGTRILLSQKPSAIAYEGLEIDSPYRLNEGYHIRYLRLLKEFCLVPSLHKSPQTLDMAVAEHKPDLTNLDLRTKGRAQIKGFRIREKIENLSGKETPRAMLLNDMLSMDEKIAGEESIILFRQLFQLAQEVAYHSRVGVSRDVL